jgi:hypothetical protein
MFGAFEIFNLAIGLGFISFGTVRYVRERSRLRTALKGGEAIAEDGWLTEPDEPGYMDLYNKQQRQAFSGFGHLLMVGGGAIATGLHVEVRHSLAHLIGLL